jgi:hypothetical protein
MGEQGFIFSLDAFVAFTLIMVTISLLIFTIGTPKPYYPSLEQAHQLAHDTLMALATSSPDAGGPTYLDQILINGNHDLIVNVAGGDDTRYNAIIPKGFGYRLETVNINDGAIRTIYDSKTDPDSDRFRKEFSKLQASATIFTSNYEWAPGESSYCYLNCRGYDRWDASGPQYVSTCNVTPCDSPKDKARMGNGSVQMVRLVVYT